MPKCPKCKNDIATDVIKKSRPNPHLDHYLFKCPSCQADLEVPWTFFSAMFMIAFVPSWIAAINIRGSDFSLRQITLLGFSFFLSILMYALISKFIFWRLIKPRLLSASETEQRQKWLVQTKGILRSREIIGIIAMLLSLSIVFCMLLFKK